MIKKVLIISILILWVTSCFWKKEIQIVDNTGKTEIVELKSDEETTQIEDLIESDEDEIESILEEIIGNDLKTENKLEIKNELKEENAKESIKKIIKKDITKNILEEVIKDDLKTETIKKKVVDTKKTKTKEILFKKWQFIELDSSHWAKWDVKVIEKWNDIFLVFENNFQVWNGPDLKILLSKPQTFWKASKWFDLSKTKFVWNLIAFKWSQTYKISKSVWNNYNWAIVIWCEDFDVHFSNAILN